VNILSLLTKHKGKWIPGNKFVSQAFQNQVEAPIVGLFELDNN
jgi:hypothetical protein